MLHFLYNKNGKSIIVDGEDEYFSILDFIEWFDTPNFIVKNNNKDEENENEKNEKQKDKKENEVVKKKGRKPK